MIWLHTSKKGRCGKLYLFILFISYLFCRCQVQLTDFENAAYVVFVVLLTRVILSYKLDFLIPLSKVKATLC